MTENSNMAGLSWRSALLALSVTLLVCTLEVNAGSCFQCIYDSNGKPDSECISRQLSPDKTRTIPCNFNNQSCTIFTKCPTSDENQPPFVSRGCEKSMERNFSCNDTTRECKEQCRTDLCNEKYARNLCTHFSCNDTTRECKEQCLTDLCKEKYARKLCTDAPNGFTAISNIKTKYILLVTLYCYCLLENLVQF